MFLRVAEFHRAFGHPVSDVPHLPDQSIRDLRIRLIKEELDEYCAAFKADDRIEMADGLVDLLYLLAGTAVAYGFAPDEPVESPYDGRAPFEGTTGSYAEFLKEDFATYLHAEKSDDIAAIQSAVFHMMVEIFSVARQSSIPVNAVFAEVHRSNLSKLMPDGSVLRRNDGKILKGPNYSPPDIAKVLNDENA